jgi:DNA polymerase
MANELTLDKLQEEAAKCSFCELHAGRNNPAFARGNSQSNIIVCGMCPGPKENEQGIPFVGDAGKILDTILLRVFGGTDSVYITNLVKCFVKPGISLQQHWMSRCLPYFIVQISLIKPKVILALGQDVCNYLLDNKEKIGQLRGKTFKYLNTNIVCSYHPSYLQRGGGVEHKHFNTVVKDFELALQLSAT